MIISENGDRCVYSSLFQKIFGDEKSFADKIADSADRVFEVEENDGTVATLSMFDIEIKVNEEKFFKGAYLYGAMVKEEYRGRGIFTKLCHYVSDFYKNHSYDFILTLPAEKSLFPMYRKLGFSVSANGTVPLDNSHFDFAKDDVTFSDFDGDFDFLYSLHKKCDALVKSYDFFVKSVSDFNIKYVNGRESYALFDGNGILYIPFDYVKDSFEKALIMKLSDGFFLPDNILCDILFEI